MQVDVLTLRYDPTRGVLDDTALSELTRDKVVLGVRDQFYQVGSIPHLTLVIEYRTPSARAERPTVGRPSGSDRISRWVVSR